MQDDTGYVMWNDEFPSGHACFTGGHAKGVLGFGTRQGFWLLHSVGILTASCSIQFAALPSASVCKHRKKAAGRGRWQLGACCTCGRAHGGHADLGFGVSNLGAEVPGGALPLVP